MDSQQTCSYHRAEEGPDAYQPEGGSVAVIGVVVIVPARFHLVRVHPHRLDDVGLRAERVGRFERKQRRALHRAVVVFQQHPVLALGLQNSRDAAKLMQVMQVSGHRPIRLPGRVSYRSRAGNVRLVDVGRFALLDVPAVHRPPGKGFGVGVDRNVDRSASACRQLVDVDVRYLFRWNCGTWKGG